MKHQVFCGINHGKAWRLVGEYDSPELAAAHEELIDALYWDFVVTTVEVISC